MPALTQPPRRRLVAWPDLVALAAALGLATPGGTTTVERLDLSDLSTRAHRIVVATCQQADPVDLGGRVYTRVRFAVRQTVKGPPRPYLDALFAGGQLGDRRQWVPGMPAFRPAEEVVLFLSSPDAAGRVWPIGLAQGKYRIQTGPDGQPRVVPGGDEAPAAGAAARAARPAAGGVPLEEFLDRVRQLLGQPGSAPDAR